MYLLVADIDYISDRVSKSGGRPWSNPLQIWHPPARTNMLWYSDRQNEGARSPGSKGKGRLGTKQEHLEDPTARELDKSAQRSKARVCRYTVSCRGLRDRLVPQGSSLGCIPSPRELNLCFNEALPWWFYDGKSVWRTFDFSTTRLLEMVNWVRRC